MDNKGKIKAIEKALGQKEDGVWDDKDMNAFTKLVMPKGGTQQGPPAGVSAPQADPAAMAGAAPTTYS
jgi:hypothetical protein